MSDAVQIFLSALACTMRVVHQVPPEERTRQLFLEILERTLDSRQLRKGIVPETTIERVRANQDELNEMLSALRQMNADPTLMLLDPSEGPSH